MIKCIQIQIICISLFTASCSNTSNELLITGGAATGAACGYAVDKKSPWTTVGGSAVGSLLASAIIFKDKKSVQKGFDIGYIRGVSDAIKRHYWMSQELHKHSCYNEKQIYLSIPAPTTTSDGRNLVPHNVVIPIIE